MRTYLRFVLGVIALGLAALMAQGKGGQNPGGHLRVTEVLVDFNAQAIEITGEDFDFGLGPLTISLGELGDISALSTVRFLPYQAGFPTKRIPSATPQVLAPRRFTTAASYGAMRPAATFHRRPTTSSLRALPAECSFTLTQASPRELSCLPARAPGQP